MSRVGLDWYKREPLAYLTDVQGLTAKQHAVYSVVVDLLYVHGGEIRNDPSWISGWISDMGAAAVRRALADLDANPAITILITDTHISQKRAKSESKTKRIRSETASISGKKGGEKSAEIRRASKENNDVAEPNASSAPQAEKRREEKSTEPNGSDGDAVDPIREAVWKRGTAYLVNAGIPEKQAKSFIGKCLKDANGHPREVYDAFAAAKEAGTRDPVPYISKILQPDVRVSVRDVLRQATESTNAK